MNIADFIDYWDLFLQNWNANPNIQFNNYCRQVGITAAHSPLSKSATIMPEPYYGNPYKCSAVILNFNPSTSPSTGFLLANKGPFSTSATHTYSRYAFPFSLISAGIPHSDSIRWWKSRKNWIRLLKRSKSVEPFAVELCPWHSNKWKDVLSITKGVNFTTFLDNTVIEPAMMAIKNSAFPCAFAIGASFQNILKKIGFEECGYWHQAAWQKFMPKYIWRDGNRKYKLFRRQNQCDEYDYILVTWTNIGRAGANKAPLHMTQIEKQIIKKI